MLWNVAVPKLIMIRYQFKLLLEMTIKHGPDLTYPHGLQVYSNDKQDTWLTTHI